MYHMLTQIIELSNKSVCGQLGHKNGSPLPKNTNSVQTIEAIPQLRKKHQVILSQCIKSKLSSYLIILFCGTELVNIYKGFFSASVSKEHGCSHSIFSPQTYFDSFQGVALIKWNVLLNLQVVFMATSHDHSLQFPGSDVQYLSAEVAVSLLIADYWFKQHILA